MSDDETRELNNTLLNTDDGMVWAQEFVRIFAGKLIQLQDSDDAVGENIMAAWFSHAMMTAVNMYERKQLRRAEVNQATEHVSEGQRRLFVEGVNDGREGPTDLDDPTA